MGIKNAPIHVTSKKQPIVANSSTESELIALHMALEEVTWTRNLIEELGYPQKEAIEVEQDNQSTVILANRGPGRMGRSKAINIKYFWVSEQIENGLIKLKYVPSEEILADGLTKNQPKEKFLVWRNKMLNM